MDKTIVLSTSNLSFSFRRGKPILDNININVPRGSIYGFLGPNGAGKTTTMRLLTGLLPQQGDQIQFFNQSLKQQLPTLFHKVGTLIETPSMYLHLTGWDNLRLVARLQGIDEKKVPVALEWVDLHDAAHKKLRHYSLGMKQRLAIAMALLSEPEILLLDEPVNGLDPAGMVAMRELFLQLNKQKGITIFISSHLLPEVEKMCTHIGIIHRGKMRFEGTLQSLSNLSQTRKQLTISVQDAYQWLPLLQATYSDIHLPNAQTLSLTVNGKDDAIQINRMLVQAGAPVAEVNMQDGLEDWFIQITKQGV